MEKFLQEIWTFFMKNYDWMFSGAGIIVLIQLYRKSLKLRAFFPFWNRYDVFISCPVCSIENQELFKRYENDAKEIKEHLKQKSKLKKVYCFSAMTNVKDGPGSSEKKVATMLKILKHCRYYMAFFPQKVCSGALVEVGIAIALRKPSVIFVYDKNDIPRLLQKIPNIYPFLKVYVYKELSDFLSLIDDWGEDLFWKLEK